MANMCCVNYLMTRMIGWGDVTYLITVELSDDKDDRPGWCDIPYLSIVI